MAPIIDSFHDIVNYRERVILAFTGQMQVDHGGFELAVTEITLNRPDMNAGFRKMGCIRVA